MRSLIAAALLVLSAGVAGAAAPAQDSAGVAVPSVARSTEPSRTQAAEDDLLARVGRFEQSVPWFGIPDVAAIPSGPRVVAAGDTVQGPIAARGGPIEVRGVVLGDVVAYEGDVLIQPGGLVTGDAVAVLGRVRLMGGTVSGELRSVRGSLVSAPAAATPVASVRGRLGLVVGWLTMLVLIGIGVLLFASGPLDGVVDALQESVSRSLILGIAGQLAFLPVLLLLVVALAITVLGILLIPFAVVAMVLAAAGLMTLGFLAVARIVGGAVTGRGAPGRLTDRGATLRSLVVGIVLFVALWLIAALLTPAPIAAAVVRGVALTLTWVAATAGFGAALRSRAGTRRPVAVAPPEEQEEEISWLTPTPIGGVMAARRPTSGTR